MAQRSGLSLPLGERIRVWPEPGSGLAGNASVYLTQALEGRFGIAVEPFSPGEGSNEPVLVIAPPGLWRESACRQLGIAFPEEASPEGYRIEVGCFEGRTIAVLTGQPLYAARAFFDCLEVRQGDVVLPEAGIVDHPRIARRGLLAHGLGRPDEFPWQDRNAWIAFLDWLAYARLNALHILFPSDDSARRGALPELIREASGRGIAVYGGVRALGRTDEETMARLRRETLVWLEWGAGGILFWPDSPESFLPSAGGLPGKTAPFAPYVAIFRDALPDDGSVDCLTAADAPEETGPFCLLTLSHDSPAPQADRVSFAYAGPRSLAWWNPTSRHLLPDYEGYDELVCGWNTGVNWSGGELHADTDPLPRLRQIESWVASAWIAPQGEGLPGNEYAAALWGMFAWNPSGFEQGRAERKIIEDLFGEGTHAWMQRLNDFYHYALLSVALGGRSDAKERWTLDQCSKLLAQAQRRFRGHASPVPQARAARHFDRISGAVRFLRERLG
ncbi:MAG: hypothetical protein IT210_18090 [Armatimonadetes bacterium]|nr:hypothetical protein [Armatimonadota bacterium]